MRQERLEEITRALEEDPDMPYMFLQDAEALEAAELLRGKYKGANLVMMRGIRYITVTDAALGVVLERLERERREQAKVLEQYDRDLAGVRGLLGSQGRGRYWSAACTAPEPADRKAMHYGSPGQ